MNGKMRSSVIGLLLGQFSSPLPEVQKEPVAYLYNGVRLPKLPEWDREEYPYAVISTVSGILTGTYATLVCLKNITAVTYETEDESAAEYYADGVIFSDRLAAKSTYDKSTGAYSDFGDFTASDSSTLFPLRNMVWSNANIYKPDGTLYLSASDPIPVYE